MRALTQNEIACMTRTELSAVAHSIASQIPALPEGSLELRIAHYNLHLIRIALGGRPSGPSPG